MNLDPDAHAIIYAQGAQPFQGPNEPRMMKEPIEVAMDNPDETVPRMSRLNFRKIHTVEHNVKISPIGRVSQRSMARFVQYTRDEMRNIV